MEHFYRNMHILPKMSHLTPRGAYVLNYPLGQGIYFEQLLICFNFNMTSFINIQYFEVKLTHFLSKNVYFAENVSFDPLGCKLRYPNFCCRGGYPRVVFFDSRAYINGIPPGFIWPPRLVFVCNKMHFLRPVALS